jgi:hypothetical protein
MSRLPIGGGENYSLLLYARLYEAETSFLQVSIRNLQTDLEKQLTDLAVSTDQDSLPEGQFDMLATRQRVGKVLRELLQTPGRDRHHLECILRTRLGHIHQQLDALEQTVEDRQAYDEAHWQLEHERQVLKRTLEDWQRWLRDTRPGQEEDSHD